LKRSERRNVAFRAMAGHRRDRDARKGWIRMPQHKDRTRDVGPVWTKTMVDHRRTRRRGAHTVADGCGSTAVDKLPRLGNPLHPR
jgi:hypothetical protein